MGTVILDDVDELTTIKISELPALASANSDSVIPIVDSENTYKITEEDLNRINIAGHSAFVDLDFTDNEDTHEFNTIQAAIDWIYNSSWFGDLDSNNKAVVIINAGKYEEQIHSYQQIVIIGQYLTTPVTIYNTGVDSINYPLRSDGDEYYEMVGINIETAVDGKFGKIPKALFKGCCFTNGHFIERDSSCTAIFENSIFTGSDYGGFYMTGTDLTGYRNILIRNFSEIDWRVRPTCLSTHTEWANFQCDDSNIKASVDIEGDWEFRANRSNFYRDLRRNTFNTPEEVHFSKCIVVNGIHFESNPSEFILLNSSFEWGDLSKIPDGEADITADVTITDANITNNVMHNGMAGEIQISSPTKTVGCRAINRYFSLQDAINSIAVKGVVDLRESFVDLAELTIPSGVNVTIDGHKLYSLTFTNDIVELGASEQLVFYGLSSLNGGNIEVNGNGAYVAFEETLIANAYVTLTSGTSSYCLVYTSSISAPTGHPAIKIDNTDVGVVSGYSRIRGGVGHPALMFTVDASNKLKAKFSTILHGDGSSNVPIGNTSGVDIDISMYSCGLNAAWSPADFTNTIGSAGNITDTQIDF